MKCQNLLSGKTKKNVFKCRLLKILPRVLSVQMNNYFFLVSRKLDALRFRNQMDRVKREKNAFNHVQNALIHIFLHMRSLIRVFAPNSYIHSYPMILLVDSESPDH